MTCLPTSQVSTHSDPGDHIGYLHHEKESICNQHIKLSSLPILDSIWIFLPSEPAHPEMKLARIT